MCNRPLAALVLVALSCTPAVADEYLGQLSADPFNPNSLSNPFGAGNPYKADGLNNPFSRYGNPYSNQSATNPYATEAPKLYDSNGNYRGKLSSNPYDPESISNPYGRYGNPLSSESINNSFGAGNPYRTDSPTNPYGQGLSVFGQDPSSRRRAPSRSYDLAPSVPTVPSYQPTSRYGSPLERSTAPRANPYEHRTPPNPYAVPSPRPSRSYDFAPSVPTIPSYASP